MEKYKIAIVAPVHIQPTDEWINSLASVGKNCDIIIVDDSDGKVQLPSNWSIYGYEAQKEALGDELYAEFEPFHKSSACRNFGHWIAYKQGYDIIIGLDSDCNVPPDFVAKHLENLMSIGYRWENPIKNTGWYPRGFPYFERQGRIIVNMGVWSNELDVNGMDRVKAGDPPKDPMIKDQDIAHGMIPLCGMNFACWVDAIPGFLFLPNFDDGEEKFRRYDDIWGGYIFQKLMKKKKELLSYGNPVVFHDTIVDAQADAELETAGIRWEEFFYSIVDNIMSEVEINTYPKMFQQFANLAELPFEKTPFKNLMPGLIFWAKLYA